MLRHLFLWLHIAIAVVAFGPTFTFPFWMAYARRQGPPIVPFTVGTIRSLFERIIIPLAVVMPFTGVALIYVSHIRLWGAVWLELAIGLYTLSFFIGAGLGLPNVRRILTLMAGGPDAEAMAEIGRRAKRQAVYGYTNNALVLTILALMVWKPGA